MYFEIDIGDTNESYKRYMVKSETINKVYDYVKTEIIGTKFLRNWQEDDIGFTKYINEDFCDFIKISDLELDTLEEISDSIKHYKDVWHGYINLDEYKINTILDNNIYICPKCRTKTKKHGFKHLQARFIQQYKCMNGHIIYEAKKL